MTYNESNYEAAFISMLQDKGWQHIHGSSIPRNSSSDVLYLDDMEQFFTASYPDLPPHDLPQIINALRFINGENDSSRLRELHSLITNGIHFTSSDGKPRSVFPIDFDHPSNNIFRAVNQFTVSYTNNGQTSSRRPDILLYVNGLPLCIIELKNPAEPSATLKSAWEQIYACYWRDIPHLLRYCLMACISDGVHTRLGTVRTHFEHFYAWKEPADPNETASETHDIIRGVLAPERFLEILRDYVYFPDPDSNHDGGEIICRYPQFFAARLLKQSIVNAIKAKSGKGGTYFGATGCGKTYTMAFLARQLALRCEGIGSPTFVVIVDRTDLQEQAADIFMRSKNFLCIGDVRVVQSRRELRNELTLRESGGFYICTVQKFCDRKDDPIGLINERANIICFSDEAHRTQIERAQQLQFSRETMRAEMSRPYSQVLREAFPNATFAGFTGTPIAETYQTFGGETARYPMDQAVADGLTVPIKYHPRIARVFLDGKKADEIEEYYRQCAEDGATLQAITASKRAMSSMEVLLGERSRLERLAEDIHDHYEASCANNPGQVQKAMIVCSSRKNAYTLLTIFMSKYPEWFVEKKCPDDEKLSDEDLRKLTARPFMAMIASTGVNDDEAMYDYLGGLRNDERNREYEASFKQDSSNFRVAIVVDMWITGFDVPSLTYLYNDKPLKRHMLIQTISRVNRKYPGKEYGLVVDYIGIREQMREAMRLYGGDMSVAHSADDVEEALHIFREKLYVLKKLFYGYDLTPFLAEEKDPAEKYTLLMRAAEYVFASTETFETERRKGKEVETVAFSKYFLKTAREMRGAYTICQPSGELDAEELSLAQCFMAAAGLVRTMNGTSNIDSERMNSNVARMVEAALKYSSVESILDDGQEEDIFSDEYTEQLKSMKMPATRLEMLIKILRRAIYDYARTNLIAAKRFKDMLEDTIKHYHERRKHLSHDEAGTAQEETVEKIIESATEQALRILRDMKADRESFREVGLTFEEKAFYDILTVLRDKYNFEYGDDKRTSGGAAVNEKCKSLAVKIKQILDDKTLYSDWLNNQLVRDRLKFAVKVCLIKNGYPPQYSPNVFREVMKQVNNFESNRAEFL